jgi:ribosomal protein L40E
MIMEENMKYCRHCGAEMFDDAVLCVKCGRQVESVKLSDKADAPNMGFAVLSFFIPLVGLILYLTWKEETPLKAKSCGKGALIGVIVSVAGGIIATCATIAAVGAAYSYF